MEALISVRNLNMPTYCDGFASFTVRTKYYKEPEGGGYTGACITLPGTFDRHLVFCHVVYVTFALLLNDFASSK